MRLLGRLFDEPGLLHPFATRWRDLLTSLTFVEKDRHLLTHGMLNAEMNEAKELTLTFTAYDFHHERRETLTKTVDEMRYLVGRFGDEAEAYLILIAEILKATRFDILPVGPLQPLPREPRDF